jgi:tetratricopeptide (TPR) repeat protein
MTIASRGIRIDEDIEDPRVLLSAGLIAERAGRIEVALDHYAAALETSADTDAPVRSEALRRLAVLHNLRGECGVAQELAQQAYQVAMRAEAKREGAEALNALAGFAFEMGDMTLSERHYGQARDLAARIPELVSQIEHNLGILANVRGNRAEAMAHFQLALTAAEHAGDARQAAMAHHNLGVVCMDLERYADAQGHYEQALSGALALGERHLKGLCHLNMAEMHLLQGRSAIAKDDAEAAFAIFEGLDSRRDKGAANRILGMIFRDSDRPALAESKLSSAIEMARSSACPLSEAEARREIAELYQRLGRRTDALRQLEQACSLFGSIEARTDQEDVRCRLGALLNDERGDKVDRRRNR